MPARAAVGRLPGQMPGTGINCVGILRIDRDGFDVLDISVVCGRHAFPAVAAIVAAEDAVKRSGHQYFGIPAEHCHGADGLTVHRGQCAPVLAAVASTKDVANLLAGYAPG